MPPVQHEASTPVIAMAKIANSLSENGFLLKEGVFSRNTVNELVSAIDSVLSDGEHEDIMLDRLGFPIKIKYPLSKHPSFLESLSNLSLIQLVDSLFPKGDAILTWEDVLVKQPNSKTEVLVHQDMALQITKGNVFSIGLSLHEDSHNPVYFLPGSHKYGALTRSEVQVLGSLAGSLFIPAETRSGDALVHDVKCVHYSKPMLSDTPRYTWYLEFRSESDLRKNGPWEDDWIDSRKAIWNHAKSQAVGNSKKFAGPLRIPHITPYLSYDLTSEFNHFINWNDDWKITRPHIDNTHHCTEDAVAIYGARFEAVLPFHPPGLAPVSDGENWYYILPDGTSAFPHVFTQAFGFYCGFATVEKNGNWFHIKSDGTRAYNMNWAWCGNFQQNRCSVRDENGYYHHIRTNGNFLNSVANTYAGDFREGVAVVRDLDGYCRHIDLEGEYINSQRFYDLDVYHKGFAKARDSQGWHHINKNGEDISRGKRYSSIEPFYNGQALVKRWNNEIYVIDELGSERAYIQRSKSEHISELNESFIAYWRPLAVRLGILAGLTSRDSVLSASKSDLKVIEDAWINIGLQYSSGELTPLGQALSSSEELLDRAMYWTGPQLTPWIEGVNRIINPILRSNFFEEHSKNKEVIDLIQRVLNSYAADDWNGVSQVISFENEDTIVDIAGGKGALLREFSGHSGKRILVDLPEVIKDLCIDGIETVPLDMFNDEIPNADVYLLSRVLHDLSDEKAINLLLRLPLESQIVVIDRINDYGVHGLLSLNMLLTTGGRERSTDEWNLLFTKVKRRIIGKVEWKGHSIWKLEVDKL